METEVISSSEDSLNTVVMFRWCNTRNLSNFQNLATGFRGIVLDEENGNSHRNMKTAEATDKLDEDDDDDHSRVLA
jgi:hypothetical protein